MSRPERAAAPVDAGTCLTVLFFGLFYLYVWLRIDPRLLYQSHEPIFLLDGAFLAEHLLRPGGLVEYLAALLLQLCFWPWLGALLITLLSYLVCRATHGLIARMGGTGMTGVHLLPAVFVLMLQGRYDYPAVDAVLGVLLAMLFLVAYVRVPVERMLPRLAIFLLFSLALYHATAAPCLLFALLGALFEILVRRRFSLGGCVLLAGLGIPYLAGARLFGLGVAEAYTRRLCLDLPALSLAFYLCIPVVAAGTWALAKLSSRRKRPAPKRTRITVSARRSFLLRALPLLSVALAAALASFDGEGKAQLQVDYYAQQAMWPEVLQTARGLREGKGSVLVNTRRALYHTGRLLDDMFLWRQVKSFDVIPTPVQARDWIMTLSDLFLELGDVSYAEKWAHEAFEMEGDRPEILKRLAEVQMLKGRMQAARVFLCRLKASFPYRKWAADCLGKLEGDGPFEGDEELRRIRSTMHKSDYPGRYRGCEAILHVLLHTNRNNRMAFEYLVAHYLLSGEVEKAVEQMARLTEFGYARIPRHLEEALLFYALEKGVSTPDVRGLRLSAATCERYKEFSAIVELHRGDVPATMAALAKDFGGTYWFYGIFGETGTQRAPAGGTRQE